MKHILLFITLLTGCVSFGYAQEEEPDRVKSEQKIKALYVAYITQQLNLNEEEAQRFWPLHKQFESELKAVDQNQPELPRQQASLDIKKTSFPPQLLIQVFPFLSFKTSLIAVLSRKGLLPLSG